MKQVDNYKRQLETVDEKLKNSHAELETLAHQYVALKSEARKAKEQALLY